MDIDVSAAQPIAMGESMDMEVDKPPSRSPSPSSRSHSHHDSPSPPPLPAVDEAVFAQQRLAEHALRMNKRRERLEGIPLLDLFVDFKALVQSRGEGCVEIRVRELERGGGWEREKWRVGGSESEGEGSGSEKEKEKEKTVLSSVE
ncbi:hypothetical protein BT69DRAFT_413304 [Atractiella rhizophila]|nr:hypothetical protein BT69DRAFT_413304 [Atractiella rhizophila]